MSDFIFAAQQGRKIPKEDKNFAVNNRAKDMIAEKDAPNRAHPLES